MLCPIPYQDFSNQFYWERAHHGQQLFWRKEKKNQQKEQLLIVRSVTIYRCAALSLPDLGKLQDGRSDSGEQGIISDSRKEINRQGRRLHEAEMNKFGKTWEKRTKEGKKCMEE